MNQTNEIPPEILEALSKIQTTVSVPKNHYNSFGKYSYRNAEDILNAVKKPLHDNGLTMVVIDGIEHVEGRHYVKAEVWINGRLVGQAYAREEESKKGMDGSQITGTASSYARKYALNGVFLLDDVKDADSDEHASQQKKAPPKKAQREEPPPQNDPPATKGDWYSWTIPFKKSEHYGKSLEQMVAEGEVDTLQSMLEWMEGKFDPDDKFAEKNRMDMEMIRQAIRHAEGASDGTTETVDF